MGRRGEVLQYTDAHNTKPDERASEPTRERERETSSRSGQPSKKKGGIV